MLQYDIMTWLNVNLSNQQ